jgi:hypothetical protein
MEQFGWHFDYIQAKSKKATHKQGWTYGCKESTRILGPFSQGEPQAEKESGIPANIIYKMAIEAPTVQEGLDIIKKHKPRDYCLYGNAIKTNLANHHIPIFVSNYKLSEFNHPPLKFGPLTSLVWGDTNNGKTSFVVAHFKNPLVVTDLDILKHFSPDNDGIVFDDVSLIHLAHEHVIQIIDNELDRYIRIRYTNAHIPKGTIKVFVHNHENPFYESDISVAQKEAIDRRIKKFAVAGKLYTPKPVDPNNSTLPELILPQNP